jgi:hypothetical protein
VYLVNCHRNSTVIQILDKPRITESERPALNKVYPIATTPATPSKI